MLTFSIKFRVSIFKIWHSKSWISKLSFSISVRVNLEIMKFQTLKFQSFYFQYLASQILNFLFKYLIFSIFVKQNFEFWNVEFLNLKCLSFGMPYLEFRNLSRVFGCKFLHLFIFAGKTINLVFSADASAIANVCVYQLTCWDAKATLSDQRNSISHIQKAIRCLASWFSELRENWF